MNQKVFVYCDNLRVFDAVLDIFKQTDIDISYFCAPKFSYLFSTYPFVTPLDIKENSKFYVDMISDSLFTPHKYSLLSL